MASDSLSNDILWQPLEEVVEFELPLLQEPQNIVKQTDGIEISVQRNLAALGEGDVLPPSTHLLTRYEHWESYALSCPLFRLAPLAFAVNRNGECFGWWQPVAYY